MASLFVAHVVMAYIVMAHTVMAHRVSGCITNSAGPCACGWGAMASKVIASIVTAFEWDHFLCECLRVGSDGLCSHVLHRYGLSSHVLHDYGLYSYGP